MYHKQWIRRLPLNHEAWQPIKTGLVSLTVWTRASATRNEENKFNPSKYLPGRDKTIIAV